MEEIIPFRPKDLKQAIVDRICGDLQDGINVFAYLAEKRERWEAEFRDSTPEYFENMPIEINAKCKYIVKKAITYTDICIALVKDKENYYEDENFKNISCKLYRVVRDFGELHRLNYFALVEMVEEYIPEEGNALQLLHEIRELMGGILNVISQKVITNAWMNYNNQLILHMSALLHTIDNAEDTISF